MSFPQPSPRRSCGNQISLPLRLPVALLPWQPGGEQASRCYESVGQTLDVYR